MVGAGVSTLSRLKTGPLCSMRWGNSENFFTTVFGVLAKYRLSHLPRFFFFRTGKFEERPGEDHALLAKAQAGAMAVKWVV